MKKRSGQVLHAALVALLHRTRGARRRGRTLMISSSCSSLSLPDRRKALGQDLAVAAVRAEDVVVGRQRERHADRRRLLPDREVRRSGVVVRDALVRALGLDLVEDRLELPDGAHVLPDVQEIFAECAWSIRLRWSCGTHSPGCRRIGSSRLAKTFSGSMMMDFGMERTLKEPTLRFRFVRPVP